MFSCFNLMILLVLEFMLGSRIYLIPFLEYSCLELASFTQVVVFVRLELTLVE